MIRLIGSDQVMRGKPEPGVTIVCAAISAARGAVHLRAKVLGRGAVATPGMSSLRAEREAEMSIEKDLEAEIVRLYLGEKWKIGTIATQLKLHHSTVERALATLGLPQAACKPRPSIVDPYLPFIVTTLEKYPRIPASRLYHMVRERGYTGTSEGHFRSIVSKLRPMRSRGTEAYHRLRTLAGEQGQVDWGHFGKIEIGQAKRWLMAFVLVLSYSRQVFLRFFTNQRLPVFLRGHIEAFERFDGVPRELLYDNPKTIVLERNKSIVRFNPELLNFAKHYRYKPVAVGVARGNEKGRVERAIRYIRQSFWPAREYKGLDDLNAQADDWCKTVASTRKWLEDPTKTVKEAFEEERSRLLALPDDAYTVEERVEVRSGKTPYLRFDLNDYSIPHTHVRRAVTIAASASTVRVLSGGKVLATHNRSYDKGQQIEDPKHVEALTAEKRLVRGARATDRLHGAAPNSQELLALAADRGNNMGSVTAMLLKLLDTYGARELEIAITEAMEKGVPHPHAVRSCLEHRRERRNLPPALPVVLPEDSRLKNIVVRPHDLSNYTIDTELKEDDDGDQETDKPASD